MPENMSTHELKEILHKVMQELANCTEKDSVRIADLQYRWRVIHNTLLLKKYRYI